MGEDGALATRIIESAQKLASQRALQEPQPRLHRRRLCSCTVALLHCFAVFMHCVLLHCGIYSCTIVLYCSCAAFMHCALLHCSICSCTVALFCTVLQFLCTAHSYFAAAGLHCFAAALCQVVHWDVCHICSCKVAQNVQLYFAAAPHCVCNVLDLQLH